MLATRLCLKFKFSTRRIFQDIKLLECRKFSLHLCLSPSLIHPRYNEPLLLINSLCSSTFWWFRTRVHPENRLRLDPDEINGFFIEVRTAFHEHFSITRKNHDAGYTNVEKFWSEVCSSTGFPFCDFNYETIRNKTLENFCEARTENR